MKRSQLLVTALVLAFPVTASAQHGVVRGGQAAGAQNQQMIRQQQQAVKQQQQMGKAQQRAFQQQAKQQQKLLAAQQKNATKGQQKARDRKQMPPSIPVLPRELRPDMPIAMPRPRRAPRPRSHPSRGRKTLWLESGASTRWKRKCIARVKRWDAI